MAKSNTKFQNVPENATKKREIATLLTFSKKQRKILQRFYPKWDFFTPTLMAGWYVFTSLYFVFNKNPAYGRQSISQPMRIVAPIPQ